MSSLLGAFDLLKSFIFVGYANDWFFPDTNPYTSNVTQQWRCSLMLIFRGWATCVSVTGLFFNFCFVRTCEGRGGASKA